MKIAIFHNFLDNMGGAEFVSLVMAKELDADVYTTNIDKDKIARLGFFELIEKKKIKSIGKIPLNAPFRQQLALWRFRRLNLKKQGKHYDLFIIAGDWAMSGAVNNKPNIWYVHSPLNELWAFNDYIRNHMVSLWKRPLFDSWVGLNRFLTRRYSKHIQNWVCSSVNVQKRINKYYRKRFSDIKIINPPTDTSEYEYRKHKNYWLCVSRFTNYKRLEIQIKAFSELPKERLIIAASYEKGSKHFEEYKAHLESIKPENVDFALWPSRERLKKLYGECKGFIVTAKNEDFGITPVEAMASGKPVIAPNEGGYKETIIDGKTGKLIDDINPDKVVEAVKEIGKNPQNYKEACLEQARKFDTKIFIEKIKKEIENGIKQS